MEEKVLTRKQAAQKEIGPRLKKFKKELRKNATPAEKFFKNVLKKYGLKFSFQKPFYRVDGLRCIVDFISWDDKPRVVIEIDGGYHNTKDQINKDEYRTNWLLKHRNCVVVRFTNEEVLNSINDCILNLADFYLKSVPESNSNNYTIFKSLKHSLCR